MLVIYALANIITKEREQLFKFTTVSFVVLYVLSSISPKPNINSLNSGGFLQPRMPA